MKRGFLRKILCSVLALACLCGLVSTAGAAASGKLPAPVPVSGTVASLEDGRITLENGSGAYRDIILMVTGNTLFLHGETGAEESLDSIQEGDVIHAYVSPAMTMSLPPIAKAAVIFCDVPAKSSAPTLARVEEITTQDNGNLILETNQDVNWHVSDETKITAFRNRGAVQKEQLETGRLMIAWYDQVAMSSPAQATPSKILVLPSSFDYAALEDAEIADGLATPTVYVFGTVTQINGNLLQVENQGNAYPQIILAVGEDSYVLDGTTGRTRALAEIQVGDFVYAYVSAAMTRSAVPQAQAELIICGVPEDAVAPTFATVMSVTTQGDGSLVLVTDQSVNWTITGETEILSYPGIPPVSMAGLQEGMKILAWYDFVAMSMPAQAAPRMILVLPFVYSTVG